MVWRLVDPGYRPIDWQMDFKSGFRWSARTWSQDIKFGDAAGADVKVPWELARMQHLPRLALAWSIAANRSRDAGSADRYRREFRNEILDFVASNPPRFGVNWVTAMDVAIRVSNWLLGYDLFLAHGATFDPAFEAVLGRSVVEHGDHIATHLEWSEVRGNHYLANVVGLLFVAAHLPDSPEARSWFALARRELRMEVGRQFLLDGSNFESSTSYHRLSGELAAYGLALLIGMDSGEVLPTEVLDRLPRIAAFSMGITKPTGEVPQIGDNDSGRLFDLGPLPRQGSPSPSLDHRALVGALSGLLVEEDVADFAAGAMLEAEIVRSLAGAKALVAVGRATPRSATSIGSDSDAEAADRSIAGREHSQRVRFQIDIGPGATDQLERRAFPEFGLFIFRSRRIYLAIRCGSPSRRAPRGHAHNDQLSIELQVDGVDWIRDPGTYVYTPLPERRNAYRSMHAHFGPRLQGGEPARLDLGRFDLGQGAEATCTYWGEHGFAGRLRANRRRTVVSRVYLDDTAVHVSWAVAGDRLMSTELDPKDWRAYLPNVPFSPGYGIVESASS